MTWWRRPKPDDVPKLDPNEMTADLLETLESFLNQIDGPPDAPMPYERFREYARRWLDLEFGEHAVLKVVDVSVPQGSTVSRRVWFEVIFQ